MRLRADQPSCSERKRFPAFRRLERGNDVATAQRVTENGRRAKYSSLTNRGRDTLARATREWQRQTALWRVFGASPGEL